ncbi:MAG: hypothetical protein RR034_01560, partial [Bacteroidales bacterium]
LARKYRIQPDELKQQFETWQAELAQLHQLQDPETGKYCMIDTSDIKVRKTHATWWHEQRMRNKELFQKVGVDVADLYTNKDYVSSLTELFRRR